MTDKLPSFNSKARIIVGGVVPFAFVVLMLVYILGPGSNTLSFGVVLPEIIIEKIDFLDSEIKVTVRNTGTIPVDIAVADVDDRIQPAAVEPDSYLKRFETSVIRIPFVWNEAQPYTIGVTLSDGTRFEKSVDAASPAPTTDLVGFFAVIGTFVGIIPIMIGLMWLPFIKRVSVSTHTFFLALTVGLLLFLGIDAVEEALNVASESGLSASFNGTLLVFTVVVITFLGLHYFGERLVGGYANKSFGVAKPMAVALMIAASIGLHNFGEGLVIGAAVGLGSLAFSAFLIVGFALHNTTEGIAIASAAAAADTNTPTKNGDGKSRKGKHGTFFILKLAGLGILAGSPAIFGAWLGGLNYSPLGSIIFISIGAGAIFQVVIVVLLWLRGRDDKNNNSSNSNSYYKQGLFSPSVAGGVVTGLLIMYLTSILI